jgi:hypothetical protein
VPVGVIAMLSQTVPGVPDQGCHIQLEDEAGRVERARLPRLGDDTR